MRFKIEPGSDSGHDCCFQWTIIDTEDLIPFPKSNFVDQEEKLFPNAICECFREQDAILICSALNKWR
jgi:hypothetical protein